MLKLSGLRNEKLILVVDDDDCSYMMFKKYLAKSGIDTLRSSTGTHAIESCKANLLISLVLLDFRLPDISGIEVCKSIKSFRPDLTVIFQSACDDPIVKKLCLGSGGLAYLTKPISYIDLISVLPEEILEVH